MRRELLVYIRTLFHAEYRIWNFNAQKKGKIDLWIGNVYKSRIYLTVSKIFCIQIYYDPNSIFFIEDLFLLYYKSKCRTRVYSLNNILQLQPEFLNILNHVSYLPICLVIRSGKNMSLFLYSYMMVIITVIFYPFFPHLWNKIF